MRIQIRFIRAWSHFKLAKKFEACIKTWYVRVPWKFFTRFIIRSSQGRPFSKTAIWFLVIRPQGAEATSQSHFRWQETVLNYFIVGKFNGNTITNSRSRVSPPSLLSLSLSFFPPPSISLTISMSIASRISKPEARYSVHGVRKVAFIRRANFINPRKKFPLPWIVEQNF